MAKRQFKFYFGQRNHVNISGNAKKHRASMFGGFLFDVAYGVCFRVGNSIYKTFAKFASSISRDYELTITAFAKRLELARDGHFAKTLVIFIAVSCIGFGGLLAFGLLARGLELKNSLLSVGHRGGEALIAAKTELQDNDFTAAQGKFLQAYNSFTDGRAELERQNHFLNQLLSLLPQKRDSDKLFEAAALLSEAGSDFTRVYGGVSKLSISQSGIASSDQAQPDLRVIAEQAGVALSKVNNAITLLNEVNVNSLPHGYKEKLLALKNNFEGLQHAFQSFKDLLSLGSSLVSGDRHILLVLENNNELRPGGGFIGTYGDMRMVNGSIKSLTMSSIYDLDGQLKEKIRPPFPVFQVNDRWYLRDSNWFSSWPESAKKISDFYEKEGGETPDVIIAMTPSLIQNLLKITGPVTLPRYGVTLTSENFVEITQIQSSVVYDHVDNKPK